MIFLNKNNDTKVDKDDKKIIRKKPNEKDGIINFYEVIPTKYLNKNDNPNFKDHNMDIPFRACVCAPSGSGKTNFVLNILKKFSKGKGTFVDIYIITNNKDEPLYNWLGDNFNNIHILEGMANTPNLDDMDKSYNTLVIWDDLVINKNQEKAKNYFMRARKQSCCVIYISQSYFDILPFIRKNSNYLFLFDLGGSKREQTTILKEWGRNLTPEELTAMYEDATSVHMRPLIIQGGKVQDINKKYRKGFTDYYTMKEIKQLANDKLIE